MNSINPIINQPAARVTQSSALRKAAVSPELPNLTQDESSLIKEQFAASKPLRSYSMDGKMNQYQPVRGSNFDARI